jgi:hypothetical protein
MGQASAQGEAWFHSTFARAECDGMSKLMFDLPKTETSRLPKNLIAISCQ